MEVYVKEKSKGRQKKKKYKPRESLLLQHNGEEFLVVDVQGDGNCFYRAVSVLLGLPEGEYKALKLRLNKYVVNNAVFYSYLGNINQLAELILREGEAATYECIRVAADCLHRTLVLHRGRFPSRQPEEFACPPNSQE